MNIKKVIIPAAGQGTRFLPYTRAVPKEMLPLVDKPLMHYIVKECADSQLSDCIIITNPHKQVIENYFCKQNQYQAKDIHQHKFDTINRLINTISFEYVQQIQANGLGDALLHAQHLVTTGAYIAISLPDDIIFSSDPALLQLIRIAQEHRTSVVAVQEVTDAQVSSYGIIAVKEAISSSLCSVSHIIEKPSVSEAPSRLAVVGRYVLSDTIFQGLRTAARTDGELQLTAGINNMIRSQNPVLAYKIKGRRFDTGTPKGWLEAVVTYALHHPAYRHSIQEIVQTYQNNTGLEFLNSLT